jgi:hypothetical protein
MSERAEACRHKTLESERAAFLATSRDVRRIYLDLAHQWRDMAEQAEELARYGRP